MGIRTKFNPMGGSNGKFYTLTIVTNPAAATCTLTINSIQYVTKSKKVKEGTVVSYSVYHSTYGTKTGSITVDSNITLTFIGETSYTLSNNQLNVIGSPTVNAEGHVSNFSSSNYIRSKSYSNYYLDTTPTYLVLESKFKFSELKNGTTNPLIQFGNFEIRTEGNSFYIKIGGSNTVTSLSTLTTDTWYQLIYQYSYMQGTIMGSCKLQGEIVIISTNNIGNKQISGSSYIYFGQTATSATIDFSSTSLGGSESHISYSSVTPNSYSWAVTQS